MMATNHTTRCGRIISLHHYSWKLVIIWFNPGALVKQTNTFPAYIISSFLGLAWLATARTTFMGFKSCQYKSTMMPPRSRVPWIEPFGHWEGSAGSSVIFNGVSRVGTSGACSKAFYIGRSDSKQTFDGPTNHHSCRVCKNAGLENLARQGTMSQRMKQEEGV